MFQQFMHIKSSFGLSVGTVVSHLVLDTAHYNERMYRISIILKVNQMATMLKG